MKFLQIAYFNKIMLNYKKVVITSFFHNGTLFQYFEFCQLWRAIKSQNFIFIKNQQLCCTIFYWLSEY